MDDKFTAEVHSGPVDSAHRQTARVALRVSDHTRELRLAQFIRNWDGRGISGGGLADFIEGLSRVGSYDLTGSKQEMVMTYDGKSEPNPVYAILAGTADVNETLNFLLERINKVNPNKYEVEATDPSYALAELYSQYRDDIQLFAEKRHKAERGLYDEYSWNAFGRGNVEAKTEFSRHVGPEYEQYKAERLAVDQIGLPNIKKLISDLHHRQPLQQAKGK